VDVSKEGGVAVNAGESKYRLMSRHQSAGQGRDIKTDDGSFENVDKH
jgi:hypothetical protein